MIMILSYGICASISSQDSTLDSYSSGLVDGYENEPYQYKQRAECEQYYTDLEEQAVWQYALDKYSLEYQSLALRHLRTMQLQENDQICKMGLFLHRNSNCIHTSVYKEITDLSKQQYIAQANYIQAWLDYDVKKIEQAGKRQDLLYNQMEYLKRIGKDDQILQR